MDLKGLWSWGSTMSGGFCKILLGIWWVTQSKMERAAHPLLSPRLLPPTSKGAHWNWIDMSAGDQYFFAVLDANILNLTILSISFYCWHSWESKSWKHFSLPLHLPQFLPCPHHTPPPPHLPKITFFFFLSSSFAHLAVMTITWPRLLLFYIEIHPGLPGFHFQLSARHGGG